MSGPTRAATSTTEVPMPPFDARVLAAIVLMGAVSVGIKVWELIDWHVRRRTLG